MSKAETAAAFDDALKELEEHPINANERGDGMEMIRHTFWGEKDSESSYSGLKSFLDIQKPLRAKL